MRVNKHELAQTHVFHGPRCRAHIARVSGVDENNPNIALRSHLIVVQIRKVARSLPKPRQGIKHWSNFWLIITPETEPKQAIATLSCTTPIPAQLPPTLIHYQHFFGLALWYTPASIFEGIALPDHSTLCTDPTFRGFHWNQPLISRSAPLELQATL